MRKTAALAAIFLSMALVPAGQAGAQATSRIDESGLLGERTFEFTYRLRVTEIPEEARSLSVWIPLPRETPAQDVERVSIDCDLAHTIVHDPGYGNRILYIETAGNPPREVEVDVTCLIRRRGYRVTEPMVVGDVHIHPADIRRFLQPDRLVPTDGPIAARAGEVLAGVAGGNLERARALYEDVLRTMRYDRSGSGWGRGDALYACDAGAGNCTDFHSLFIGLARAAGIPARFVMGFPLPPNRRRGEVSGYHCWAEFYDERLGWVPVDASEAWKHPEMREFLFGGLDPNRVEFTLGRDIPLVPADKAGGEVLNYFIYPYVVVDGRPHGSVVQDFTFRDATG